MSNWLTIQPETIKIIEKTSAEGKYRQLSYFEFSSSHCIGSSWFGKKYKSLWTLVNDTPDKVFYKVDHHMNKIKICLF